MAEIFDIVTQKAQTLRFVNLNKKNEPQNRDNRLFADLVYPLTAPEEYCLKIQKDDYLRIHYRTDYATYTVNICSNDGSKLNIRQNETLIYEDTDNGLNYYDCNVVLGFLNEGVYWIQIELEQPLSPIVTFKSDPFYLKEKWEDTLFIECFGNLKSYDDSQYWVDRQGIRVKARDNYVNFMQEKNVDLNTDYTQRTLKAKPNRAIVVDFDKEPEWVYEKVNIFLNHDEFYINDIRYNNDEAVQVENLGKLIQYKSTLELIEYEYQDGSSEVLTGDIPPTEENILAISDTDDLGINNNDELLIQG